MERMKRREETPGVSLASARVSWDWANSNNGKYGTTFKEFQIVWPHTPGEFNYLDICWVITKAIKWFLNYVEDSFMRQQVRTRRELKSFWLDLERTGGASVQVSGALRGLDADLASEVTADTAVGTKLCFKWICSQKKFLWQFLKKPKTTTTTNHCICGTPWRVIAATCVCHGRGLHVNKSNFQENIRRLRKGIDEQFRSTSERVWFLCCFHPWILMYSWGTLAKGY